MTSYRNSSSAAQARLLRTRRFLNRRFCCRVALSSARAPSHRRKKSTPGVVEQKSLWNAEIIRQAVDRLIPEAESPLDGEEPGDVCRRGRQRR